MPIFNIRKSKILIVGGTGFLGSRVALRLKKDRIRHSVASLSTGVDFRDINQTKKFFQKEKPEIVINCAAYVGGIKFGLMHCGEVFFNNNLMSTNLIEASRLAGVKVFVNPIANCTYPNVSEKFKEDEWWDGPLHDSVLVYGMARKTSWVNAWAYNYQYSMHFINLIMPSMYGPGDHFEEIKSHALGAMIMKFMEAKKKSLPEVVIWGTGKPIREWLYVDDGVEAILRSLKKIKSIDPVNIGRGEGVSIGELAAMIKKLTGYRGEIVFDTSKPDGAPFKIFDVKKMKKIFRWSPPTKLEQGIKKTIDWYVRNYN